MSKRILATVLLIVWPLTLSWASAADASRPELLVVYWSSKDCKWCTYWESSWSGMEKQLKEFAAFKKITYRVVKNERLADPYTKEHFPPDILWLYERIQRGEEKRGQRPSWVIYLDRKRLAAFYGTTNWDEKHFPAIQRLVAEHVPG